MSALLMLLAALALGSQERTPEATVRQFVSAFFAGDLNAAARLVVGKPKPSASARQLATAMVDQGMKGNVEAVSSKIIGTDRAIVSGRIKMSAPGRSNQAEPFKTNLRKVSGEWLIAVPDKKNHSPKEDAVGSMAVFLTQGLDDVFARAKEAAKRTACLSNIKQLALATIMFASDNDDVVRLTAANWKSKIMPYAKNSRIFVCPLDKGSPNSYGLNPAIAGKSLGRIKEPARTILVYEGSGGRVNFRHGGSGVIAMADGRARAVNKQQASSYRWKP